MLYPFFSPIRVKRVCCFLVSLWGFQCFCLFLAYNDSLTTLCSLFIVPSSQTYWVGRDDLCRQHVPHTTYLANIIIIPLHSCSVHTARTSFLTRLPIHILYIHTILYMKYQPLDESSLQHQPETDGSILEWIGYENEAEWIVLFTAFSFLFSVHDFYFNVFQYFWNIPSQTDSKYIYTYVMLLVYSPSLFIPICKHFFNRHAWHWFLWALSTTQRPVPAWHLWEIKGVFWF